MTESEAKGFVQGKLDCMKKCDIFNKEDNTSDNDCDNCEYCYSQGNFGEQKEAFQIAIQALEKQVPMKVKNSGEGIPFEWYCPACGELLCDDGYKDTYIKYCEHCGQKIDWSDGVDG